MDPFPDFVAQICELRRRGIALEQGGVSLAYDNLDLFQVFTATWSSIRESSTLTIRSPLDPIDWQYLMKFLAVDAGVSQILHLELVLPSSGRLGLAGGNFGNIVGRFSALQTLKIESGAVNERDLGLEKEEPSLMEVLKLRNFRNLQSLSLSTCNFAELLQTLIEGRISQLRSFEVTIVRESRYDPVSDKWNTSLSNDNLQAVCRGLKEVLTEGLLENLRHLKITNAVLDIDGSWKVFAEAIKVGLLSKVESLHLKATHLETIDLGDLVPLLCNSLESLTMESCGITSRQVCGIRDAIMKARCNCNVIQLQVKHPSFRANSRMKTRCNCSMVQLGLKRLSFCDNALENDGIRAVVDLANSDRLPHLHELDFSLNMRRNSTLDWTALMELIKAIGRGRLPSLQRLNWEKNPVCDAAVEAMAQAYKQNEALTATFDIDWIQVRDDSLRTQVNEYRARNLRLAAAKEKLKEKLGEVEPLTTAKVFFCGYPQAGKTTLRKTFRKKISSFPLKQQMKGAWQRHPIFPKQPPTRGIELSRVEEEHNDGQKLTLVLWDLAGQDEFHVLHGSFFSHLDFAGGKATTFILVFRADEVREAMIEKKLLYWLRFIASSCHINVRRHVVIVLNCFNGEPCREHDEQWWVNLLADSQKKFRDLLHIHKHPFIVDVRVSSSVKCLKDHIFGHSRVLLRNVVVPKVCFKLQEELKLWSHRDKRSYIPIFSWQAFEENLTGKRNNLTEEALKAAASILHEMGEIIYFDDKELAKSAGGSKDKSIVVAEPEWFCKEVVGELLLPKHMREAGEDPVNVKDDGSISISQFQTFFQTRLVPGTRCEHVISMLERLGICYRKGEDEIIIPTLIRQDRHSPSSLIDWEGKGYGYVMGRSLVTKDEESSEGRSAMPGTAIPGTLFRRLQVVLAQDWKFGGREDSGYRAGKTFSSFKVGGLLVLIQFDVDPSDPTDDRIDILVKSMITKDNSTELQVNCICEILEKLKVLCVGCCPGLKYDIKVMKYWKAHTKTPTMVQRELLALHEIKDRLTKGERYTNWHYQGHQMELQTFLSGNELNELLLSTGETHVARQHLHRSVTQQLQQTERNHKLVRNRIAQISFSLQDRETSVPRFMFLSRKEGGWWEKFDPFHDTVLLHLLCEAHFGDGFIHEVDGQEGIELPRNKLRDMLPQIAPWLKLSLQTMLMVAQTVGDIYLPGIAHIIPNYESKDKNELAKAVDNAVAMILDEGRKTNDAQQPIYGGYGSPTEPIDVRGELIAQSIIHDLRTHYGLAQFVKKIALRKVRLDASGSGHHHVGTSRQAEPRLVWICEDCYRKYRDEDRVTSIGT